MIKNKLWVLIFAAALLASAIFLVSDKQSTESQPSRASQSASYVELKSWGVKIPKPMQYQDLYIHGETLSIHRLDKTDACAASATGLARVHRYKAGEQIESTPGATITQEQINKAPVIDGFHYLIAPGNGTCTDGSNEVYTKARAAVLDLTESIQPINE